MILQELLTREIFMDLQRDIKSDLQRQKAQIAVLLRSDNVK